MNPYVIIINGKPGTGKTILLQKLCNDLNLTFVARDEFKEMLFDKLGIADAEWSRKLGAASYSLLFNVFEKLLKTQKNFILEGNFNPEQHAEKIKAMLDQYQYRSKEIFLDCDPSVLFERHQLRWNSGERHRGHVDNERFDEFEVRMKEKMHPLNIGEKVIHLDTTDFSNINYDDLKNLLTN